MKRIRVRHDIRRATKYLHAIKGFVRPDGRISFQLGTFDWLDVQTNGSFVLSTMVKAEDWRDVHGKARGFQAAIKTAKKMHKEGTWKTHIA